MRTLEFVADRQLLYKVPNCDFSGLVSGSVGYLRARFHFSEEWDKCNKKVASFWFGDKEYPVTLGEDSSCDIPSEVLIGRSFKVKVIGACVEEGKAVFKIETNKTRIKQEV